MLLFSIPVSKTLRTRSVVAKCGQIVIVGGTDVQWGTLLVSQLAEALRYKSEGHGFVSRWCHWNFSLT